jgi:hypothetical protein
VDVHVVVVACLKRLFEKAQEHALHPRTGKKQLTTSSLLPLKLKWKHHRVAVANVKLFLNLMPHLR